jgi:hypothetical protein
MKPLIAAALALALSACVTHYIHPTKTDREFYKDLSDCEAKAGQAIGMALDPYAIQRERIVNNCLYGEGWTKQ